MINLSDAASRRYAELLSANLKDVTDDLRTIDLGDLIAFLRFGHYATLEDLVVSSTELFFRSGTLTFGWAGGVDVIWGAQPRVTMSMEFRHPAVSVFFELSLCAFDDNVKVCGIVFEDKVDDPGEQIARLSQAIAEARLPKRPRRSPDRRFRLDQGGGR